MIVHMLAVRILIGNPVLVWKVILDGGVCIGRSVVLEFIQVVGEETPEAIVPRPGVDPVDGILGTGAQKCPPDLA
jgi:hypothetical protein